MHFQLRSHPARSTLGTAMNPLLSLLKSEKPEKPEKNGHTEKPAPMFWETDVKLPNINCDKCTLQVVQFMAEHGHNMDGDYSYHHCADLKITANPKLPIDKAWLARP